MITAVIPAKNEAENIKSVLETLHRLPINRFIVVLNGCTDDTLEVLCHWPQRFRVDILQYEQPLGIDVPRAVGARYARKIGARAVLFIDGDMTGELTDCCGRLLRAVAVYGYDLALTNCYPYMGYRSHVAKQVLDYRERLNRTLGVFTELGLATPSHGPHCVSARLLDAVEPHSLAIPPLMMAQAVERRMRLKVAASLEAERWSSAQRGDEHNDQIAQTIIGDCLQAEQYFRHQPMTRSDGGQPYMGYHSARRLDEIEK